MDTLIAMGASVAYGYSLVAVAGHWLGLWGPPQAIYFMESTGLLALISLGHWLEARARDSAGHAIRELMVLSPPTALRLDDGQTLICAWQQYHEFHPYDNLQAEALCLAIVLLLIPTAHKTDLLSDRQL